MGATSVTGVGQGSASKVGPAIKNITINDPHIVLTGIATTVISAEHGNWQVIVRFPELPLNPDNYSVFAMQSDLDDSLYLANNKPPHIAKFDANENYSNDGFDSGFAGFILHTGDNNTQTFMYMVVKNGINVRK